MTAERDKDLVRQVDGEVVGIVEQGEEYAWRLLGACEIRCQRGGRKHDAIECVTCPRFVNFVPSADRSRVRIRCMWNEEDCVGGVMTLASEIVSVTPDMSVAAAVKRAQVGKVHHLLVITDGRVVGVVCRCALVPPVAHGETVADRMATRVYTIRPWDTLEQAVERMREHDIGCLPVMEGDKLFGIISRTDLLGAGFAADRFGCEFCDRCGGHHALRPHPTLSHVTFCIDCLEQTMTDDDYYAADDAR